MRSTPFGLVAVFTALLSAASSVPHELRGARIHHRAAGIAEEYDYIIVGAGTAGLTIADRLTADGECKSSELILRAATWGVLTLTIQPPFWSSSTATSVSNPLPLPQQATALKDR